MLFSEVATIEDQEEDERPVDRGSSPKPATVIVTSPRSEVRNHTSQLNNRSPSVVSPKTVPNDENRQAYLNSFPVGSLAPGMLSPSIPFPYPLWLSSMAMSQQYRIIENGDDPNVTSDHRPESLNGSSSHTPEIGMQRPWNELPLLAFFRQQSSP